MIGDLFDSPWKILIVAVVIIVLFGSKKLPGAARSLGQSMRILKREVSDLHHEEEPDSAPKDSAGPSAQFPQAQLAPAATPPADQQGQIDALQQQIRDLQRSATMDTPANAGSTAEPQRTQQPS
ncbi:MAG: Sec-independent protein translocase subunit TatA [Streptosporangiaceae bacterium]